MTVVIMRGLPGSGKSTYVRKHYPNAFICSADLQRQTDEGKYVYDPLETGRVHTECYYNFLTAMGEAEECIVIDNTSIRQWEYINYERAASIMGYDVEIIEFVVETLEDIEICINRNRHEVPANVVASFAEGFQSDPEAKKVKISK